MAEIPKSSLRITIPASKAKASSSLSSADPMEDQPSRRKRKVPTRYQDSGDYEDDDLVAAAEPEKKVARTSTAGRTRRQSTTSEPPAVPSASNLFDDEDVEDARAPAAARVESEHDDDAHSDHSARHSSPVRTKAKTPKSAKGRAPAESASTKKKRANKRAVVVSDSDEEEAYMDTAVDAVAEETEDEYVSEEEEKPVKKGKGKAKPPAKTTAKAPPKRKAAAEASETTKGKGKAIKKPHTVSASKHEEPIIDVVGGSSPLEPPTGLAKSTSSGGASKQDLSTTTPAVSAAVPTPVLKKKLPTINKVKGATTSGMSTPTTPTPVPKKPTATHLDIREDALKKTDVNLFDSSVYNQLFAKPKAGASASSARPDNEERRKEIERQREEAKAKRKAEAAHSFDLQAQAEKIARFEETLKNTQSLYPNMVAGRWKQSFEEVRRLQREQEMWAKDNAAREEGEVM